MTDTFSSYALWLGLAGLVVAFLTYRGVVRQSPGSQIMQDLADQIHIGAMAFLRREYLVLVPFLLIVATFLWMAPGLGWETAVGRVIKGESAFVTMGDWANGAFKLAGMIHGKDYEAIAVPGTKNLYGFSIDAFSRSNALSAAATANHRHALARGSSAG